VRIVSWSGTALLVTLGASPGGTGWPILDRRGWAALGLATVVGVPPTKGGRFIANFDLHDAVLPAWTANKIALI
jgi:hypothetical protein